MQPGLGASAVLTITNRLSDQPVAGTVTLSVSDALSTTVHTESQPFTVGPASEGSLTFVVPNTLQRGDYTIRGTVQTSDAAAEVFADYMQVGLPMPSLVYTVAPDSLVQAGDVVAYTMRTTNTLDVDLTNSALTASIPAGSSIVLGSSGNGIVDNGRVLWKLGTVPAGASVKKTFQVRHLATKSCGDRVVGMARL